jgi:hypothetical protein
MAKTLMFFIYAPRSCSARFGRISGFFNYMAWGVAHLQFNQSLGPLTASLRIEVTHVTVPSDLLNTVLQN